VIFKSSYYKRCASQIIYGCKLWPDNSGWNFLVWFQIF
jgi:hypothetical protein